MSQSSFQFTFYFQFQFLRWNFYEGVRQGLTGMLDLYQNNSVTSWKQFWGVDRDLSQMFRCGVKFFDRIITWIAKL